MAPHHHHNPLLAPLESIPDPLPLRPRPPTLGRRIPVIHPPGSKSLTNRGILLAALAQGRSVLRRPLLDADDTRVMLHAVQTLGATVETHGPDLHIVGINGRWKPQSQTPVTLDLHNAGTAVRFLAAAALLSPVPVTIDGTERMRRRPIGELGDALRNLGATIEYLGNAGCPPIRITPPAELPRAATLDLPRLPSSQFISALLLLAPWLDAGLSLTSRQPVTSASYARMTLLLLSRLGATVRTSANLSVMRVGPPADSPTQRGLHAFELDIEPDASSATYFWAAGALSSACAVRGLLSDSLQADAHFPALLARMGATVESAHDTTTVQPPASLDPVFADLADLPDAAMTLAAVACFATGRSILRGLGTLRDKESNRIDALRRELAKIGVTIDTDVLGDPDAITITPPDRGVDCARSCPPVHFDTYDDHRMAMSLALIGLRRPNVFINNPACVAKTYPAFWHDFATLYE